MNLLNLIFSFVASPSATCFNSILTSSPTTNYDPSTATLRATLDSDENLFGSQAEVALITNEPTEVVALHSVQWYKDSFLVVF